MTNVLTRPNVDVSSIRLDLQDGRLWHAGRPVQLRPKTWQLAQYMVARPGQLLSKEELLDAVWGDSVVTESSLSQAIRELRTALGDDARSPKFIQTVHRRGFRLLLESTEPDQSEPVRISQAKPDGQPIYGRASELAKLNSKFENSKNGERQIVFISGEPGIGKTRLVQSLLDQLGVDKRNPPLVGWGQCIDQHGEGEAYLPVLEAIDRLARSGNSNLISQLLKRYAPTWLVQLPWLLESGQEIDGQLVAVTPARMLREFCVFIEALTDDTPLVLWLEDLHWSDSLTIDLIEAVSRRVEPARLLLLASYRPAETHGKNIRNLTRSALLRKVGTEMALEPLDERAIREYLTDRFLQVDELEALCELTYEHSDGNPLFVVTLIDYMVSENLLTHRAESWELAGPVDAIKSQIPQSLKHILEMQLAHASDEEAVLLEAASVVGTSFNSQTIAGAVNQDTEMVEQVCSQLIGPGHILELTGVSHWSDSSVGQHYQFVHDVYRRLIYDSLAPGKRRLLHQNVARRIQAGHADENAEVAAELALHFELGGEGEQAIEYLILASERAEQRSAARESVAYLDRALNQIKVLPKTVENEKKELALHMRIMRAVIGAVSYTAVEQDQHISRALELCKRLDDKSNHTIILSYQMSSTLLQGDIRTTNDIIKESESLARFVSDPVLLCHKSLVSAIVSLTRGALEEAEESFKRVINLLDESDLRRPASVFGHDPVVLALGYSAQGAWLRGYPDEAIRRVARCNMRAEAIGVPQVLANGLDVALSIAHFRRDLEETRECAVAFNACLEKFGVRYPYMRSLAAINWQHIQDNDPVSAIAGFTEGFETVKGARAELYASVAYATLAEAHVANGSTQLGLKAIDKAMNFVGIGERVWEAEIYRVLGKLHLQDGSVDSAENCFLQALDTASSQGALSLELRAATSLASLQEESGRQPDAKRILEGVLKRFEEGFDTHDFLRGMAFLKRL